MSKARHAPATPLVGEQLRRTRLHLQLSLEDVATQTRISLVNLRAIESSRYDQLPADAYTRGLIKLYANHLRLDGEALAQQGIQERHCQKDLPLLPNNPDQRAHGLEANKMAEQARISSALAALALFACIIISFTGFCIYWSWNPLSYLTDKALVLTSSVDPSFHPADPTTSGLRLQNRLSLQAVFYRDCQVQVVLDNQPANLYSYMKGATIQWEAYQSMQLDFYGEHCAELQFNGTFLPAPVFHQGRATLRLPPPTHGP